MAKSSFFKDGGAGTNTAAAIQNQLDQAAASAAQAATSLASIGTELADATAAKVAAEAAQAAAETAKTASESARDTAITNRNAADASASSASTSATNSASSETNAAASQSAAATSASNAATSATAAASSQSAAATSATGASSSASSAASAQTAAEAARDSALAAFDSFDDRYLGAKSSDPSTDNDGDALVAGSLVYNTTDNVIKVYTGSAWVAAYVSGGSFAQLSGATFTGDVTVPNLITSGNVDGRDVSADGTKLDGIATGATAVSSLTDLSISDGTNGQALKTDGAGNFSFGDVATSTAFADITGKPTTIAGYGITDAFDGATTSLTGGNFSHSGNFQFLNGGAAQNILARSVYAGTSYAAATANAGEMDALVGYRLNGSDAMKTENDGWLRLNNSQSFSNGIYTPANLRADGIIRVTSINVGTSGSLNSTGQINVYRSANPFIAWYSGSSTRGAYFQYLASGDKLRAGDCNLESTGNVTAYASDERLKTDFATVENALEKVCALEGVTYKWDKEKCQDVGFKPEWDKTEIGLRAQQVQEQFPEVVTAAPFDLDEEGNSKSGDDYLTMYYDRLVPVLIEAIKELKAEVEELKAGCCHGSTV